MNKEKHTSQDFSLKQEQTHKSDSPWTVKDIPKTGDSFSEDKRKEVRQEHTNHFTSREGYPEKK